MRNPNIEHCFTGARIWFHEEKKPYKVRARTNRYLICTKPFNLQHTMLYTVVDLEERVRGTENVVFGMGAETEVDCLEMAIRLADGDSEVSHRNRVPLRISRFEEE